jgi:hypothetical protein
VPGCCESGNEPSSFINWEGGDFLRGVSGKMTVARSWFVS